MNTIKVFVNGKETEVTLKDFKPRTFTAEEYDALVAKAGQ